MHPQPTPAADSNLYPEDTNVPVLHSLSQLLFRSRQFVYADGRLLFIGSKDLARNISLLLLLPFSLQLATNPHESWSRQSVEMTLLNLIYRCIDQYTTVAPSHPIFLHPPPLAWFKSPLYDSESTHGIHDNRPQNPELFLKTLTQYQRISIMYPAALSRSVFLQGWNDAWTGPLLPRYLT